MIRNLIFVLLLICLEGLQSCSEDDVKTTPGGIAVFDLDGNMYVSIIIGEQEWLAQDIRTTRFNNGEFIPTIKGDTADISGEPPAVYGWSYEKSDSDLSAPISSGLLYSWEAANDPRGICPPPFRVPTKEDWEELIDFAGGAQVAGGKLKPMGTAIWFAPNSGATNEFKFSAFPGGIRSPEGNFTLLGSEGLYWTSTEIGDQSVQFFRLLNNSEVVLTGNANKNFGISCRCIRE